MAATTAAQALGPARQRHALLDQRAALHAAQQNPHLDEQQRLHTMAQAERRAVQALLQQGAQLELEAAQWGEVDRAFSRQGIQSFALEGVLGELQVSCHLHSSAVCLVTSAMASRALRRRGCWGSCIQSFALEGALGELHPELCAGGGGGGAAGEPSAVPFPQLPSTLCVECVPGEL